MSIGSMDSLRLLYPRVIHRIPSWNSFAWVHFNHFRYEFSAIRWEVFRHMKLSWLDFPEYFLLTISVKWHLTSQELINTDPKWPNIALFSIISTQNLRRNIVRSSSNIHFRLLLVLSNCETKVNKFDFICFSEHYVFWLDISMDDILRMTMLQCPE